MEPTISIENEIEKQVDRSLDDMIGFLRQLVGRPSTLSNEYSAQQLIHNRLLQLGLTSEMWQLDINSMRSHPLFGILNGSYLNRPDMTAPWQAAASGGHSLVLNSYMDAA